MRFIHGVFHNRAQDFFTGRIQPIPSIVKKAKTKSMIENKAEDRCRECTSFARKRKSATIKKRTIFIIVSRYIYSLSSASEINFDKTPCADDYDTILRS
jgi:uncharacterized Zn finger protein